MDRSAQPLITKDLNINRSPASDSRVLTVDDIMQNAGDVLAILQDASGIGGSITSKSLLTIMGFLQRFMEIKKVRN
jgi:hypothetical protein